MDIQHTTVAVTCLSQSLCFYNKERIHFLFSIWFYFMVRTLWSFQGSSFTCTFTTFIDSFVFFPALIQSWICLCTVAIWMLSRLGLLSVTNAIITTKQAESYLQSISEWHTSPFSEANYNEWKSCILDSVTQISLLTCSALSLECRWSPFSGGLALT